VLRVECLTPRSSIRSARPSSALDQIVTAADGIRPTAPPAPSRESGFVHWPIALFRCAAGIWSLSGKADSDELTVRQIYGVTAY
jgi:hypothetical protein